MVFRRVSVCRRLALSLPATAWLLASDGQAAAVSRPAVPLPASALGMSSLGIGLSASSLELGSFKSSGFLRSLQAGSPALPRFDAELPSLLPVAVPDFRLETPAFAASPAAAATRPPASPADRYRRIVSASPSTLEGLSALQMADLWKRTYTHKIAGLDEAGKLEKYDPDGIVGFCFGRAMTAHLLARKMGLPQDHIKKLFVIGDLRSGDQPEWRFHVTTLVKGADGRWHAIDPIMDGPLTADEWIVNVHEGWDRQKKAKFYLTDADAILPDITEVPDLPKETAAKIIELAFDPEGKPGFSRWSGAGETVYAVDHERQERHLRLAGSEAAPFDFLQVTVNGQTIGYNGYFVDLLPEIERPALSKPRSQQPFAAVPPAGPALGLNVGKLNR
ncbi:MAG: hypothetical protein HY748_05780 [Elusimicrobia bacterium]|nr:hypothetical protein [Elusimicrobiota bacterium]